MNSPLRIALLLATPGSTWGGMEKHTLDLARHLADGGHQVHILADRRYQARFAPPLHFHALPVHLSRHHPWLGFSLGRLLRRIAPDIAHAQGNKAAQLLSGPAGKSCRTSIGTVHGTKTSHRAFKRLDGVIAVSSLIAESLEHPRVTVIPNGCAVPARRPARPDHMPRPPADGALVVAAGRLVAVKGFDNLLKAWADLSTRHRLVILGEGPERAKLESQAQTLGFQDRVLFMGFRDDVPAWLSHADACVISSHREGFPYLMVEALLVTCPVLATPVSGVMDCLPHNSIARDSSSAALASLLAHWLDRIPELRAAQQQAFQTAATTLTLEAMTTQTLAFYRACLSDACRSDA
ncbi:MAG: glycosyltransferase [Marinobacter sp.]|uniref:glycosyltransferase n=1 Tax=Marinobacter sp. TaxID=50741 RepID=UPI00299DC8CA|nr:glycosyltransferase [Marinobacter sp.]MDX1634981.1 glycosyltransferase [Marinobacter sp.]